MKHWNPSSKQMIQSTLLLRIQCKRIEDGFDRRAVAYSGIDHQVEAMSIGPLDFVVLLDKVRAVAVYRFGEFPRFLFAFAGCLQATHSLLKGRVNKNVK